MLGQGLEFAFWHGAEMVRTLPGHKLIGSRRVCWWRACKSPSQTPCERGRPVEGDSERTWCGPYRWDCGFVEGLAHWGRWGAWMNSVRLRAVYMQNEFSERAGGGHG